MSYAGKIILALDKPNLKDAQNLLSRMPKDLIWVKVGLELFTAEGPSAVRMVQDQGKRVFLDLKLHDIPNTVAGAVGSAAALGVDLLTLHAAGGPAMMSAAVKAKQALDSNMKLLGITVLTSMDGSEFPSVYSGGSVTDRVISFARGAEEAGLDGIVCSPQELEPLNQVVGPHFYRVTPGIRLKGGDTQDQMRIATPEAALASGATHLVIGRALTQADDPTQTWNLILEACDQAIKS
jgi:orotidine-5'-phosphate decarboxylase